MTPSTNISGIARHQLLGGLAPLLQQTNAKAAGISCGFCISATIAMLIA
jgi:hypothetical protein